jgi:hypothetical protein
MPEAKLRPVTVYLPPEEVEALEREADEEGRSGASAQARYVLLQHRRELGRRRERERLLHKRSLEQ